MNAMQIITITKNKLDKNRVEILPQILPQREILPRGSFLIGYINLGFGGRNFPILPQILPQILPLLNVLKTNNPEGLSIINKITYPFYTIDSSPFPSICLKIFIPPTIITPL